MQENENPSIPLKEIHRLQRLYDFDVLDAVAETNHDRITRIACEVVGHCVSLLAFVDDSRICIKCCTGPSDFSSILNQSPDWRALLLAEEQKVITAQDALHKLAKTETGREFAFCVLTPLKSMEGFIIGSLAVFGYRPFPNEPGKLNIFDGLAQVLMDQLAIRLKAKKAFKAHLDLLHHTVHDLKNPLNNVILSAEIISSEADIGSSISEYSATIIRNAKKMEERLNRLLDLSKMEDENYHLNLKDNDLIELIRAIIGTLENISKEKNQKIFLKSDKQLILRCDYERMEEIFENLISNAIKFSPADSVILIEIRSREEEVVIVIKDEGQGLTRTDQEKLFTKFAKLSAVPTGMETSHGLGLSIVKTLVELHMGKVWAESEGKGMGSSFFVSLPI
jgi:signal transduction histidine kinase